MVRTLLASAVMGAALVMIGGCGNSSDTTTSAPPPSTSQPSVSERVVEDTNHAVDKTKDAMGMNNTGTTTAPSSMTTGDNMNATTQPGTSATSNMPGLPSVNGTSVKGMSTADAAAQRLIDAARNDLTKSDPSGAKKLVDELKQPGMYDSLSATMKSQVDQLATDVSSGAAATPK